MFRIVYPLLSLLLLTFRVDFFGPLTLDFFMWLLLVKELWAAWVWCSRSFRSCTHFCQSFCVLINVGVDYWNHVTLLCYCLPPKENPERKRFFKGHPNMIFRLEPSSRETFLELQDHGVWGCFEVQHSPLYSVSEKYVFVLSYWDFVFVFIDHMLGNAD